MLVTARSGVRKRSRPPDGNALEAACPARSMPMSSMTIRSAQVMRAMVRATDPSTAARPVVVVRDSRVNRKLAAPASMVLPVPEGPAMAMFSCRPIHSRVASPDCVPGVSLSN